MKRVLLATMIVMAAAVAWALLRRGRATPDEGPAPHPGATPAEESVVVLLRRYRDELCACRELACAEALGKRHAAAAWAAEHRSSDAPGVAELRKSVNDCLFRLSKEGRTE